MPITRVDKLERTVTGVFVTTYEVEQLYGGPEEGGWYYFWHTPVRVEVVDLYHYEGDEHRWPLEGFGTAVTDVQKRIEKELEPQQPQFDITSCASDGPRFDVLIEQTLFENASAERPHYE
jgi:hypothetical protein